MPEEQAFAVLVKIMYNYGHRDVFKANFQNLHLMFYQLERLIEVRVLKKISTHMYILYMTIHSVSLSLSLSALSLSPLPLSLPFPHPLPLTSLSPLPPPPTSPFLCLSLSFSSFHFHTPTHVNIHVGISSRSLSALPGQPYRDSHVCLSVVSHHLHCQVPSFHCLQNSGHLPL